MREGYQRVDDEEMQQIIDSKYSNDLAAGFVVVLHEATTFQLQILLPEEDVRRLEQIDGRIVAISKGKTLPNGRQVECSVSP
jgi:hypothetical protein